MGGRRSICQIESRIASLGSGSPRPRSTHRCLALHLLVQHAHRLRLLRVALGTAAEAAAQATASALTRSPWLRLDPRPAHTPARTTSAVSLLVFAKLLVLLGRHFVWHNHDHVIRIPEVLKLLPRGDGKLCGWGNGNERTVRRQDRAEPTQHLTKFFSSP